MHHAMNMKSSSKGPGTAWHTCTWWAFFDQPRPIQLLARSARLWHLYHLAKRGNVWIIIICAVKWTASPASVWGIANFLQVVEAVTTGSMSVWDAWGKTVRTSAQTVSEGVRVKTKTKPQRITRFITVCLPKALHACQEKWRHRDMVMMMMLYCYIIALFTEY